MTEGVESTIVNQISIHLIRMQEGAVRKGFSAALKQWSEANF